MRNSWATSPDARAEPQPGDAAGTEGSGGVTDPAGAGVDLHLDLDLGARTGGPRAALMGAVRDAIRTGRLAPGTRLPSSRSLASDLGLARNTVAGAYSELTAEGWLSARQGSGTRVAPRTEPLSRKGPSAGAVRPESAPAALRDRWNGQPEHDLWACRPDVSSFPRSAWLTSARRALMAAPAPALAYGSQRGVSALRRALADYLARARGVRTDPSRIVICAGFSQGLSLLARAVGRAAEQRGEGAGPRLAVEEYGLSFHHELAARESGAPTVPVPLDGRGARTDTLDALPASVRAVLLTPAHQFPTGAPLHADRRAAVVDWARRTDALVVEDDYDGEFRYDRHPVGALQGLDPDHVAYVGTASKSLAPGLRLAWMVLPDHLVDAVLAVKHVPEWNVEALNQLTLADFLECGAYDRHVRAMRLRYRRRRDRLVAALASRAPHVRPTGVAAGLHAILELPPYADEYATCEAALARGVGLDPLADFHHPSAPPAPHRPALIVGYGTPAEHAFPAALDALCEVLR